MDPVEFLGDLFSYELPRMNEAAAATAPGSPADTYVRFQIQSVEISLDAGELGYAPNDADAAGESVEVCDRESDTCTTYADFTSREGLLSDFTVNGNAIQPRLVGAQPAISDQGVNVVVLGGYRSVSSDTLFIQLSVSVAEGVELFMYSTSYVDPAGRQVESNSVTGPTELVPGATGRYELAFPRSDAGGVLRLTGIDVELRIPVPPLN